MKIFKIFLILFFFNSIISANQLYYNVEKKGIQDGLPHIDILAISEDQKGYVWFVTRSGLCRYDGYNVQTFTVQNELLSVNRMNSLVLKGNYIWIGTQYGLLKFNIATEQFSLYQTLKISQVQKIGECKVLFIDSHNRLWLNNNSDTYSVQLVKNQFGSVFKLSNTIPQLSTYLITDVKEDNQKNLWLSSTKGLIRLIENNGKFKLLNLINTQSVPFSLKDEFINTLHFDQDDNLYIGNYKAIHRIQFKKTSHKTISNIDNIQFIPFSDINIFNTTNTLDKGCLTNVTSIKHDKFNQIWIGTQTGVLRYNPNYPNQSVLIQESNNKPFALSAEMISSLYVNRDGSLFIGTIGGGLNIIDTKQKQVNFIVKDSERPKFSITEDAVRCVVEEENGDLWIGLQSKGLSHFNSRTLIVENYDFNTLISTRFNNQNFIRSLYLEDNKYLWIGGLNNVFCFDIQTKKLIKLSDEFYGKSQIVSGYFTKIVADNFGNLWLSGWGKGLVCCKRSPKNRTNILSIELINTDKRNKLHIESTTTNNICIVPDNKLLVSTDNGFELVQQNSLGDPIKVIHYGINTSKSKQLSHPFIWDIIPINNDNFYMGTLGGGVNKVSLIKDKSGDYTGAYKAELIDSLQNNKMLNIECMILDHNKNLWLAGNKLLMYNNKSQKNESYDFSQFTSRMSFKVGSSFLGKNGQIYFGSSQGLMYFNPADIQLNRSLPVNQITRMLIHDTDLHPDTTSSSVITKSISYIDKIALNCKQNNFTIWFSSMQYENPQNTQFKYMLEGYDDNWIVTNGKKPFASYLNLKYGNYKFKIISSNNDGVWNLNPYVLSIKITPPFYQTTIAYIIYFLIIGFLVRFIILSKSRFYAIKKDLEVEKEKEIQKEKLFQEKASFFTHLSHELRTPLTLIFSPLKEIIDNEKGQRLNTQLDFVYKNVEKMLYMVNKMIEFRKVESSASKLEVINADINSFLNQIAQQYLDWAARKRIHYSINISNEPEFIWFDPEKVESIINNLLTNAFKYTAENGSIDITVINEYTEISMKNIRKTYSIGLVPEKGVSILISDNGIGVQSKNLELIFADFYRNNVRVSEGFGIGLSLVKKLVELHRGYLELTSELGAGTDIILSLSKNADFYTDNEKSKDMMQQISHNQQVSSDIAYADIEYNDYIVNEDTIRQLSDTNITGKILIIEDDKQIRDYLRINLCKLFTVFDVSEGKKGLELILSTKPDLVICDYMLPDMDGLEICKLIKKSSETSHLPIIMITAKTDNQLKYKAIRAGITHFIEKPFSISYLFAVIINTLSSRNEMIKKISQNSFSEAYSLTSNQKDNELIKRVYELIYQRMHNSNFIIDDLCGEVGLARSVFYLKIKEITNATPNELIRDIRLKEAISKMANNGYTISEAAYKVGMSPTYFSRSFRQKYGKTPSEYIKEKKQ